MPFCLTNRPSNAVCAIALCLLGVLAATPVTAGQQQDVPPEPLPPAAPVVDEINVQELLDDLGFQDVPKPPPPKDCDAPIRVGNQETHALKVLYIWSSDADEAKIFTIPGQDTIDIEPPYCPSTLVVVTADDLYDDESVVSGIHYVVRWSPGDQKYIIDEL